MGSITPSPPSLTLSLASKSDLPLITQTQYSAFHPQDPLHVLLYPAPSIVSDTIIKHTVSRHTDAWEDSVVWLKITSPNTAQEDFVVAAAKYYIHPLGSPAPVWGDVIDLGFWDELKLHQKTGNFTGLGAENKSYIEWVMEEYHGRRRDRVKKACVLLDLCFVHSEWQGKGAGKKLVEWGVRKADELGVEAWVEASPAGRRVYEKAGFEVLEHAFLDGGKVNEEWKPYGQIDYFFMHRPARSLRK